MRTFTIGHCQPGGLRPAAATIGFFDGVHRGHRYLLRQLCADAHAHGLHAVAITFDRHPRQVLQPGWKPQLLTPLADKLRLLAHTGIEACAVLPFTQDVAQLSAQEFMRQVLAGQLGVRRLCIGYDHRFGHNREEGFADYAAYGRELGIDVVQALPLDDGQKRVSSSVVRQLLAEGRVDEAARCLGRRYALSGTVVDGFHEGRRIGFPTANLLPACGEQLIPMAGAYAVTVSIDDDSAELPAMMNIGTRPTYGGHALTMEIHILNFSGDIYGHRLTVAFAARLRQEQRFSSPQALACQLRADAQTAEQLLGGYDEPQKEE